jgi:hypothetical protein
MPQLDEATRRRLARALVSLEGTIAQFEALPIKDSEPKVKRLQRISDDIRVVLELAQRSAAERDDAQLGLTSERRSAHNRKGDGSPQDRRRRRRST